ncbi:MAG: Rrf2 family transcriptional regulator [Deltaproteobacteria bacterium]|nr:Rrf2 family transcriptional regulator [Deltaproteobacteria bacterium]
MRLSAQEEYGLRCLLFVARRSPGPDSVPTSIREIAQGEGMTVDYVGKLVRVLRQGDLLVSSRGAAGGFALAHPADQLTMARVLAALDAPLFDEAFCDAHPGALEACSHLSGGAGGTACTVRTLWTQLSEAFDSVLTKITLADLVHP